MLTVGNTNAAGKISVLVQKIVVDNTVNVESQGSVRISYEITVNKPITVTVK